MRAGTFNVQHGLRPDGVVDVPLLARTCAGLGLDLLALQEVDRGVRRSARSDLAAEVAAATGMAMVFGRALRLFWGGHYGNALLVRGSIRAHEVLPLPRLSRGEPRSVLLAEVTLDEQEVSVAVTHLSIHDTESAVQLDHLLEALAARPRPRLLLGDLNRRPEQLTSVVAAGFVLAGGGPTYPASGPDLRIDHVAADGLAVGAVEVPEAPVSDHRPLVVTLHQQQPR